ncbi:MAG: alpha/beta fold hydrolase [Bdellovibrionales bacterium]
MSEKFAVKNEKGETLYHLAYDDRGNRQDPYPVFCVHGVGLTRHTFDILAEALVQQNRRVITVDMVGHGDSDWCDDPMAYYIPNYARDCAQMISGLGLGAVDWIGISLGGLIAFRAIVEQKVAVRRLILDDVAPEVPIEITAFIADLFEGPYVFKDKEHFLEVRVPRGRTVGPLTEAQRLRLSLYDGKELPDGSWRFAFDQKISVRHRADATAGRVWNDWALYEQLTCPVLVFRGSNSTVLPLAFAKKMETTGPKARLVTIEGVEHYPSLSDEHQIEIVQDFLRH